ncbi:JAB domain-containing protein [Peptoniphilus sp. AGMB00490]|uniref:JAB domain-containing protein n=1 Tax=Peptoniphilus faecalis TaxID=2731255 RepID=A0A848RA64_9FIRM|nr:JAB domain-containing protein [Peptoniphilus faecalis]NMW84708.1 JAB domain-containing protein [Peptoniphilus faecalis]
MNIKKYSLRLVKEDEEEYIKDIFVKTSQAAAKILNKLFELDSRPSELFVMLALDVKKKIIGAFIVSQGVIDGTLSDPREVFSRALLINAHTIILAHNHPSGDANPSYEDIKMARRMKEAGEILNLNVIDNLVICDENNYTSIYKECGL